MPINVGQFALPGLRTAQAQRKLRGTRGKTAPEIQAAVNEAVRAGSPVESTTRTLKHMGLNDKDVARYIGAGYPAAPH